MSGHSEQHGEHHDAHHVNYKKIYFVLLGLLVVSILGPEIGILWVTLITAFGIAFIKANLVIQNFMHLRWEKRIMKWMLSTSVVLMLLLFAGVAPDVMRHEGTRWVNDGALAAIARGIEGADHGAEVAEGEHADAGEPAGADGAAPAAPVEQAFDARAAYNSVCASCHGATGAGDGAAAAALNPRPANFADAAFWSSRNDADLVRVIREGGAAVGRSPLMPAWGALYDEAKAQALLEYIKTFRS